MKRLMILVEVAGATLVVVVKAARFPDAGEPELVTVPEPLALNVVQSVAERYPA